MTCAFESGVLKRGACRLEGEGGDHLQDWEKMPDKDCRDG